MMKISLPIVQKSEMTKENPGGAHEKSYNSPPFPRRKKQWKWKETMKISPPTIQKSGMNGENPSSSNEKHYKFAPIWEWKK